MQSRFLLAKQNEHRKIDCAQLIPYVDNASSTRETKKELRQQSLPAVDVMGSCSAVSQIRVPLSRKCIG
jgi:hypothetical protein